MHGQTFPIELTGSCPWLTCLGVGQDIVQRLQKKLDEEQETEYQCHYTKFSTWFPSV